MIELRPEGLQEIDEGFRISPQQRRTWSVAHDQAEVPERLFRIEAVARVTCRTELEELKGALARVVARHEILHTCFRKLPGMHFPVQDLGGRLLELSEGIDLDGLPQEVLRQRLADFFEQAFDPSTGPLARIVPVLSAGLVFELHLSLSPLIADRRTALSLLREMSDQLADRVDPNEEPPMQYAEVAEWLNELLSAEETANGRVYWQRKEAQGEGPSRMPFEIAADERSLFRPFSHHSMLDGDLVDRLSARAAESGSDLEDFVLTAWAGWLARQAVGGEITLGVGFEGRKFRELDAALGPISRSVPLRIAVDPAMPFRQVLAAVHERRLEAGKWQEYCDWERVQGEGRGIPFGFDLELGSREISDRFRIEGFRSRSDRFFLNLFAWRSATGLALELDVDTRTFEPADARCFCRQLEALLASAAEEPDTAIGRLNLIGPAEREELLGRERVVEESVGPLVQERIEEQARRHRDLPAVRSGERTLAYGELVSEANRLARRLRRLGVGPEVLVPILLERSAACLVAFLGVLKAGGAYVPIDPSQPPERRNAMLADLAAPTIVTVAALASTLPESTPGIVRLDSEEGDLAAEDDQALALLARPENLAYALFTSGSTGRPKAVLVEHRQLLSYLDAILSRLAPAPGATFVLVSTFAADLGNTMIFPALTTGGCLHVVPQDCVGDPEALAKSFEYQSVDYLKIVPSHLTSLLGGEQPGAILPRCGLVLGGEAASWDLARRLRREAPGCRLFNHYGPTETTVGVTTFEVTDDVRPRGGVVPLGRPLGNSQIYLLDPELDLVGTGLAGEIYVAGRGVTRGYLGRPDLTAERFVPDFASGTPGGRMYRTGDLARRLPNGDLEFLGRIDQQVKIRGFRIEPREIELALERHPAVLEARVLAVESPSGERRLAAYVVPRPTVAPAVVKLLRLEREHRLDRLLRYELPNGLMVVHHNPRETDFLYQELFRERVYFKHGVTVADGDCVFDIGANIGLFALSVAEMANEVHFVACEPIPQICDLMRLNASLHDLRMTAFECGLGREAGTAEFSYYPNLSLFSSRFADDAEERRVVEARLLGEVTTQVGEALSREMLDELLTERLRTEQVTVQLKTVSDLIREAGVDRIDLLKVDVQKSELEVLAGIEEDDWPKIRQVVVEVHDADGRLEKVRDLLTLRGFEVVADQEQALAGTVLYDVFAVRPEARRAPSGTEVSREGSWRSPIRLGMDLIAYLNERLPAPMVPSSLALLDALPLTANGKLDLRALPAIQPESANLSYVAPRNATETAVAAIWAEVLKLPRVGAEDNFFRLGGHSLLATQLILRVRKKFQVDLPLRSLFESPTVEAMAAAIERAKQEGAPAAETDIVPASREAHRMKRVQLDPGS